MLITIGADPELFVVNPNNGSPVSAHSIFPGTKDEPYPVACGAVQVDGVAAEFNIQPAHTEDSFVFNIHTVLGYLDRMLNANKPGYIFSDKPVAMFDPPIWNDIPDTAKVLGCNPDFDAWSQAPNVMPDCSQMMRTAAGHVHIGWTEKKDIYDVEHFMDAMAVARQLDYYIGMPSLLWDQDKRRREMYGRAGACRVKPYGVEYRVPSNAWLRGEHLQRFIFSSAKKAVQDLHSGKSAEASFGNIAQDIINGNETDWYTKPFNQKIIDKLDLRLEGLLN